MKILRTLMGSQDEIYFHLVIFSEGAEPSEFWDSRQP